MDLKIIECPNCHGVIKYDALNKTGFCEYCHTEFIVDNNSIMDTGFNLSDYILFKSSSSGLDNIDSEKLSIIADSMINEDDDKIYLGWYYKGLYYLSIYDLQNAIDCWIKTVNLCKCRDELTHLYLNIVSALIRIKIEWDRANLSDKERLWYPSLKLLDGALERSEYIDYKRYDIYFYMVTYIRGLCLNSLSYEEFQSVNDTLGNIVKNVLITYADVSLFYEILKMAVKIENINTILFIGQTKNEPLNSLNDEIQKMSDASLESILVLVKKFSKRNYSFRYGLSITLTTIMFHHYLLDRMEYYSKIITPDVTRIITDHIVSEFDYKAMFKFINATEIDNNFEDCNPFNDERKRNELKKSAELTIDYLFEPILKCTDNPKIENTATASVNLQTKEPGPEKKKGIFGLFKKRKG